jgi:hypothetical protein
MLAIQLSIVRGAAVGGVAGRAVGGADEIAAALDQALHASATRGLDSHWGVAGSSLAIGGIRGEFARMRTVLHDPVCPFSSASPFVCCSMAATDEHNEASHDLRGDTDGKGQRVTCSDVPDSAEDGRC